MVESFMADARASPRLVCRLPRLPEAKCRSVFVQLCGALHYCHRTGVVHRDIKLENLVWIDDQETRLQLVDFGYAATENAQRNFAGSPHFAAPEVRAGGVVRAPCAHAARAHTHAAAAHTTERWRSAKCVCPGP